MKYLSIKNIIERLKSSSPTFFKRMRWIMVGLGLLGAATITAKVQSAPYLDYIPDWIISTLLTCGLLGTFLTSLPVETTDNTTIK